MNKIATILKSHSHAEYIAQLNNPAHDINLSDYRVGNFVKINQDYIGIIADSEIYNPNSITLSGQQEEFNIFAPDKINATDIYLKIIMLGRLTSQELVRETMPAGSDIELLDSNEIQIFHNNQNNSPEFQYIQILNSIDQKYAEKLLPIIYENLQEYYSEQELKILKILINNMQWQQAFAE